MKKAIIPIVCLLFFSSTLCACKKTENPNFVTTTTTVSTTKTEYIVLSETGSSIISYDTTQKLIWIISDINISDKYEPLYLGDGTQMTYDDYMEFTSGNQ